MTNEGETWDQIPPEDQKVYFFLFVFESNLLLYASIRLSTFLYNLSNAVIITCTVYRSKQEAYLKRSAKYLSKTFPNEYTCWLVCDMGIVLGWSRIRKTSMRRGPVSPFFSTGCCTISSVYFIRHRRCSAHLLVPFTTFQTQFHNADGCKLG